ncbi:DUF1062 domain-containing protein [Clostridium sp.]|uniref:DUF1062 domain-containing protein n=1 Tax=Clostridium sp. TaxID=1506 RepID=UPI002840A24B|nr:DUF1062 domain-containing protein [Clostridium sp.]MDR3597746.1 DUF1062 domain-containing protein [Clostridium sp.]
MSYLKKYQWELIPKDLPIVRRNCPKCNEKARYINSEKFRVNANKNSIDIWLIYQCEKCKSTWNMSIYERIKPYDINKYEYEKFLSNDKELAREYAFNLSVYNRNKAEVILEDVNYELIQKKLEAYYFNENELVIEIVCKNLIELRVDKFLSDTLGISRSKIKNMHKKGAIFIKDDKNSLNIKVRDGMEIHVLNVVENIEILEAIV